MTERLGRAFPWLLISPAILPVVAWGGVIYPYLVPKTLAFYALCFVAIAVFAMLVASGRGFFWSRLSRLESWVPAALLALAYIASAYGIDFYRSFWSTFERGDGLLMLSCAVASFYLVLLEADQAFLARLLRTVAVVGSAVAAYGIGEWLIGGGRIGSLLGNAELFAGYLDISFFATLAAAQTLKNGWRRVAFAGAVLQAAAAVLSATRGTMLALAVAGVAYLVFAALGETRSPAKVSRGARFARITLAALVVLGGLAFAFRADLARVPFAPVSRIASAGMSDADIANRLFVWKNMAAQISARPWLGVGAEHIDALFNGFYDPTRISEQWFDRSHNAFLDYAAQYGIGGLLLYLALIGSFFVAAARFARRGSPRMAVIIALLALSYAVQSMFSFDTVSSFWALLAILAAFLAASGGTAERVSLPFPRNASLAAGAFALVLLGFLVPVAVRPAIAAHDLSQAYEYQLVDPAREASLLSAGRALGTYADLEYGYQAYAMYANQSSALSGAERAAAYAAARSALAASFDRYPYDARTALYLAHVLSLAPPEAAADNALLSEALARAITESPKRPEAWFMLVNLSIRGANAYPPQSPERVAGYAAARDLMARYVALVPGLAEPHFVLAQLLLASSDRAGAAAEAAKGKTAYTPDLETARRAAAYYENVLDIPDAAFFLKEVVRLDPADIAAKNDLVQIQAYERSKK